MFIKKNQAFQTLVASGYFKVLNVHVGLTDAHSQMHVLRNLLIRCIWGLHARKVINELRQVMFQLSRKEKLRGNVNLDKIGIREGTRFCYNLIQNTSFFRYCDVGHHGTLFLYCSYTLVVKISFAMYLKISALLVFISIFKTINLNLLLCIYHNYLSVCT